MIDLYLIWMTLLIPRSESDPWLSHQLSAFRFPLSAFN